MQSNRLTRCMACLAVAAATHVPPVWAQTLPDDAQSKCLPSGPPPAGGYDCYTGAVRDRGTAVIGGVPAYAWRHGCGPTAAGMVIGYWDGHGYGALIPGDASTQTTTVNHAIASGDSSTDTGTHYADYSWPVDASPTLQPDKSSLGGAHSPHHCLGDSMRTSWSSASNYYGWSWFSDVDDALRGYVDYANATYGALYTRNSWSEAWGVFTWTKFVAEINANRPLVFLVDSDADGSTDHFVTAIGYRDTSGYQEYACLDTWAPVGNIRWERFRPLGSGVAWGIYGATYFTIGGSTDCNANGTPDNVDIAGGTSLDCNANAMPDECELGSNDCNSNNRPDDCDITGGTSHDCQSDGTPDECQTAGHDCNGNAVPDGCDIAAGTSADCQSDGTPDECQLAGHDCNGNAVPDSCDIAAGTSADCQPDGTPDECQLAGHDCNANGVPDECDTDCNQNGVADSCDLAAGTSQDCNTNGRPDECDTEHCHYLWNGFQDAGFQTPMNGLDLDGDGHTWSNPSGTATIWAFGCESGEGTDLFAQVYAPTSSPQNGYVISEYFRTAGGTLYPDEEVYSLSFKVRLKVARNAKTDWQLLVYDAVRSVPAVHIQFASTVSSYPGLSVPADRGYILVKNRLGSPTFRNTGVATVLDTCTEFRVELNNLDHTLQLYIDGTPRLNPPVVMLNATARRLDYFRLTAVSNGATAGGNTTINLDGFHLCATGLVLPADQWDCNGNGILDECDVASGRSADCNANGIPEECELGNFDANQVVDLIDYASFQSCLTDPGGAMGPGCTAGDFDCDHDVDLDDFAWFQAVFTGG